MFRVGDEVVCVDAQRREFSGNPENCNLLTQGAVYTVRRLAYGGLGVHLAEVRNMNPSGFWHDRFRKVQRKTSDLSIETFLTIKPGFEEPRRTTTPARKRERAS